MTTYHNILDIVIVGTLLYLITHRSKPMTDIEKLISLLLLFLLGFLIIAAIATVLR